MRSVWFMALAASLIVAGCGKKEQTPPPQEQQTQQTPQQTPTPPPEQVQTPAPAPRQAEPRRERPAPAPARPVSETRLIALEPGTELVVALDQKLSTGTDKAGSTFTGKVDQGVAQNGVTVVPAGSEVRGRVGFVKRAARVGGKAQMTLEFTELVTHGKTFALHAEPLTLEGKSGAAGDVERVAGGAVGGAIIGGILGGKSGVGKGAAAGGAAGAVWAVATRGPDIVLDPGAKVNVVLTRPIEVPVTTGGGANP